MNEKELKQYYKEGYYKTSGAPSNLRNINSVKMIDISEDDLISIAQGNLTLYDTIINDHNDDELVMVRTNKRYRPSIDDFLCFVEKESKNMSIEDNIVHYFDALTLEKPLFDLPIGNTYTSAYYDDPLLNDEISVFMMLFVIIQKYGYNDIDIGVVLKYISFAEEWNELKNIKPLDRNFTGKNSYLLLKHIYASYVTNGRHLKDEIITYYKEHLFDLVKINHYKAKLDLAYHYYTGEIGFEQDYKLSHDLLVELYPIEEDTHIAKTLGYIYYYGRLGEVDYLKAFYQFSIAFHIGELDEAGYKLSDLHLKEGYPFFSPRAAFELVGKLYLRTKKDLKNISRNKFADIAYRCGSYLADGVYIEKNLNYALHILLEARLAIRKRIEYLDDPNDFVVAYRIYDKILEVSNELGLKTDRIFKDYAIKLKNDEFLANFDFFTNKISFFCRKDLENDNVYHLTPFISDNDNYLKLISFPSSGISFIDDDYTITINFNYPAPNLDFKIVNIENLIDDELILDIRTRGEEKRDIISLEVNDIYCFSNKILVSEYLYRLLVGEDNEGNRVYLLDEEDSVVGDYIEDIDDNKKKYRVVKLLDVYENEAPISISLIHRAKRLKN